MQKSFLSTKTEEEICHDYLEGLNWVLGYYLQGLPTPNYSYNYYYAPLASILCNYVESFVYKQYPKTMSISPFEQLLSILHPNSANLLPKELACFLENKDSPLYEMSHAEIKMDLSGKNKEYEGIVILPIVDQKVIREVYLQNIDKVSEKDRKRDRLGETYLYSYSKRKEVLLL